jgi:outer membrane protein
MKRSGKITLSIGSLCLAAASCAQTAAPPPATPAIVTVNFNSAVLATAEAQRDLGALQKKFSPRELQLQKLNDDIEASKKQLNDNAAKLSEQEKSTRIQELSNKDKQLQREAEDFKNDSQTESDQVFQRIAQKVYAFLQEYSQQHGYSAVLERGSDSSPIVWYAASNVDITEQVVKAYNLKSGITASALPDEPKAPARPSKPQPAN